MVDEVGGHHLFQRGEILLPLRLDKTTDQGFVLLFLRPHRSFAPSCQLTLPQRGDTAHDATRRGLAYCLAAYSPECLEGEFSDVRCHGLKIAHLGDAPSRAKLLIFEAFPDLVVLGTLVEPC
jgi:hypothetical protein